MFFGTKEIVSQGVEADGKSFVTLKNEDESVFRVEIGEKTTSFFTEKPVTGSELQERMVLAAATEILAALVCDLTENDPKAPTARIVEILHSYDLRLVDVSTVWDVINSWVAVSKSELHETVEAKKAEIAVAGFGKERLDAYARVF